MRASVPERRPVMAFVRVLDRRVGGGIEGSSGRRDTRLVRGPVRSTTTLDGMGCRSSLVLRIMARPFVYVIVALDIDEAEVLMPMLRRRLRVAAVGLHGPYGRRR